MTFLLVSFAWVFFRMPTIGESFGIIGRMFTDINMPELSSMGGSVMAMLACGILILLFKEIREEFFPSKISCVYNNLFVRWAIYIVLFCMIINFGVLDGGQFIYASF